jgi:hypothetical protein
MTKRKTEKRLARVGSKTKFAKVLTREEPVRRSRNYRRGVKTELSRTRRRVDGEIVEEELDLNEGVFLDDGSLDWSGK